MNSYFIVAIPDGTGFRAWVNTPDGFQLEASAVFRTAEIAIENAELFLISDFEVRLPSPRIEYLQ